MRVLATALLVVFAACGEKSTMTQQPTTTGSPVTVNATQLFNQQCSVCHGMKADGESPLGSAWPATNLADNDWQHGGSRDAVIETITNGVPGTPMRGFQGTLSPPEIEAVADYVLSRAK